MRLPIILLTSILLVGCQPPERTAEHDASNGSLIADREATVVVSADRLAAQRELPTIVVLHVARDRAHFDEGHIPGARFLPLSTFAVNRDDQLNVLPPTETIRTAIEGAGVSDGDRVVVYGDLDGLAAARAFFALDVHGVDVAVLDGGLAAWRAGDHPITTEPTPAVERGTLRLQFDASRVLVAEEVASRLDDEGVVLLDARPAEQYSGEEAGDNIPRPGHIPGAVNLFWKDDLQADGTLRPINELRARYADVGITADREVVTYCRTGVQASHAYLVARLLGLAPLIYDGSFHDWSNNTDYPVAMGS